MAGTFLRNALVSRGATAIRRLEGYIADHSLVGSTPFLDEDIFPWAHAIDAQWRTMRRELDCVLQRPDEIPPFQEVSKDQAHLTSGDDWKTYFFYAFGYKAEANCLRCPETTRLIESIPGMTTAFFSILAPGKHIPAHRGAFKGILRYHLALKVPEPQEQCRIQVGDEIRSWHEGEGLMFDDTFRHEVWNDTDGTRVVLFVDFVRPLRFPANLLNDSIISLIKHSPFVKDGISNYEAWEAKLDHAPE